MAAQISDVAMHWLRYAMIIYIQEESQSLHLPDSLFREQFAE